MCGIVGYIGTRPAKEIILHALARLEYRGYDSAGIAVAGTNGHLHWEKAAGKLSALVEAVKTTSWGSTVGIGHTRWATHG
ncbi:MAG: glutamine--fructose-6-phosphate aminotransferase, partial [Planctomycetes bacterium]|nr:glutamine--fructose-6-phosphate aminotransferase [Planctomycetota bacterium]